MRELIKKAQNGCEMSQNDIILQHNNLIFSLIRQYNLNKSVILMDDYANQLRYELYKAIMSYSNENIKFLTYATTCLRNFILNDITSRKTIKRQADSKVLSYDINVGQGDTTVKDMIVCPVSHEPFECINNGTQQYIDMESHVKQLNGEYMNYYYDCICPNTKTMDSVAYQRKNGMSRSNMRIFEERFKKDLAKTFEMEYETYWERSYSKTQAKIKSRAS